jgi:RimJ/RimL family protein N-acetyltransferase
VQRHPRDVRFGVSEFSPDARCSLPTVTEAWVKPVVLEGRIVRMEPLSESHLDGLSEVAFDPAIWRWTIARPTDRDGLLTWMRAAIDAADRGAEQAYATVLQSTGKPIGSTRFMSIVPEHRRLEIGWTWVAPAFQRHGVNREAKYLMLRHAFEVLGANRVEFKTDSLNERANPALLGIGSTFEGTFRNHMVMPEGRLRHSNYYSVIVDEWPDVRRELELSVERHLP